MTTRYLVKFCPYNLNTLNGILNRKIWFSTAFDLNDPYELSAPFLESRYAAYNNSVKNNIRNYLTDPANYTNLLVRINNHASDDIKDLVNSCGTNIDKLLSECLHIVLEYTTYLNTGICSFSDTKVFDTESSLLMFSHYGESHEGLALIFETDNCGCRDVSYLSFPENIKFHPRNFFSQEENHHFSSMMLTVVYDDPASPQNVAVINPVNGEEHSISDEIINQLISSRTNIIQNSANLIPIASLQDDMLSQIIDNLHSSGIYEARVPVNHEIINEQPDIITKGELYDPFLRKSSIWGYEKEIRFFNAPGPCAYSSIGINLKTVLITDRFKPNNVENIMNSLKLSGYDDSIVKTITTKSDYHGFYLKKKKITDDYVEVNSKTIIDWIKCS